MVNEKRQPQRTRLPRSVRLQVPSVARPSVAVHREQFLSGCLDTNDGNWWVRFGCEFVAGSAHMRPKGVPEGTDNTPKRGTYQLLLLAILVLLYLYTIS
jgi:hypothetical protein